MNCSVKLGLRKHCPYLYFVAQVKLVFWALLVRLVRNLMSVVAERFSSSAPATPTCALSCLGLPGFKWSWEHKESLALSCHHSHQQHLLFTLPRAGVALHPRSITVRGSMKCPPMVFVPADRLCGTAKGSMPQSQRHSLWSLYSEVCHLWGFMEIRARPSRLTWGSHCIPSLHSHLRRLLVPPLWKGLLRLVLRLWPIWKL